MVKGINYILDNDATIATLVGVSSTGKRKVYPVVVTQKEGFPFITVWETSRTPEFCKGTRPTTFNYSYDVYVYALDYDEANAICDAVVMALEEQSITSPINGVQFTDRIRYMNRKDAGWIEEYKCYNKVLTFESVTHESPTT